MNTNELTYLRSAYRRGCVFCEPEQTLRIAESDNFMVLLDVAPLAAGHLVLHSKEHFSCGGEIPAEYFDEMEDLRTRVVDRMSAVFGEIFAYEHGRAGHCLSDGPEHRLCHHFHLHLVPGTVDLIPRLVAQFQSMPVTSIRDLPRIYENYGDYLYVESSGGRGYVGIVRGDIERHLLRTWAAEALGRPELADWAQGTELSLLNKGLESLR